MELQQVAANVFFVQGVSALGSAANRNFISNAGFVITHDSVVVIDALGSPALAEELVQKIRTLTPKPISHVLLTHYHADHIYGLQVFEALGAKIVAHAQAREYINSETAHLRLEASRKDLAPWVDQGTRLVPASQWVSGDSSTLKVGAWTLCCSTWGPRIRRRIRPSSCRKAVCCSLAMWCFATAFPMWARPTAATGLRRWTSCSSCP
jgi:hypothetical protein